MKLLIIRPQPGTDATAARVRTAGFESLIMPLFAIEPVAWDAPDALAHDALLLTSGNAARMAGPRLLGLRSLPVYAVGSATAAPLRESSLDVITTGTSGVEAILEMAQANDHRKLLWLAGEDRTDANVPHGMEIDVRTVYRSVALATPPGFGENVEETDAVLIHSARAAQHFSDLCSALAIDRTTITIAVLSPKIGKSAGPGWHSVVVASEPNDATLLSALQRHFTTPSRDP